MTRDENSSAATTPQFKGVLLDWRGTLVAAPSSTLWVRTALERRGSDAGSDAVDAVLALLRSADRSTVDSGIIDTDIALHRAAYYSWFAAAGLDDQLSDSLYAVECDASMNPFAYDVELLLTTLHDAGVRIGIVSDIHIDLRPSFAGRETKYGTTWFDLVDAWMLSYELGVCKTGPDHLRDCARTSGARPRPGADGRRSGVARRVSGRARHHDPAPAAAERRRGAAPTPCPGPGHARMVISLKSEACWVGRLPHPARPEVLPRGDEGAFRCGRGTFRRRAQHSSDPPTRRHHADPRGKPGRQLT